MYLRSRAGLAGLDLFLHYTMASLPPSVLELLTAYRMDEQQADYFSMMGNGIVAPLLLILGDEKPPAMHF